MMTSAISAEDSTQHRLGTLVYESLKEDIVSLRLDPGTPLQEAEVTKLYAASRTPVREALARLDYEGFLVRRGRGYRVRSFGPAEVRELYELREALEKMTVRLCIERASELAVAALGEQLQAYLTYEGSRHLNEFNLHANRFHLTIAELAGNATLLEELQRIHEKVRLISARYLFRSQSVAHAYQEHTRIFDAIRRRDVTVAEAAMREHIQGVIEFYQRS